MGLVAKQAWVAENPSYWPSVGQGSVVWALRCCFNLSHVPAPHCWDVSSFPTGYRYHITTPEGLMTTVKLVSVRRPLMTLPV